MKSIHYILRGNGRWRSQFRSGLHATGERRLGSLFAGIARPLCIFSAALLVFFPESVSASLRLLGYVKQTGLTSEKALDVAIVLEACEWGGVVSHDGGHTWQVTAEDKPPAILGKLPVDGPVRYQIVDKEMLLRSDDAGKTWTDVSPWNFLQRVIREKVKVQRGQYLAKYGYWLPKDHDKAWQVIFGTTAALLVGFGAWRCRRLQRSWLGPAVLSLGAYFLMCMGLNSIHYGIIQTSCYDQWNYLEGHWDGGISAPKWPLGFFMQMSGNPWIAPITAFLFFPATAVYNCITNTALNSSRVAFRTLGVIVVVGMAALLILAHTSDIGYTERSLDSLAEVSVR